MDSAPAAQKVAAPAVGFGQQVWASLLRFFAQPEVWLQRGVWIILILVLATIVYVGSRRLLGRLRRRLIQAAQEMGVANLRQRKQRIITVMSLVDSLLRWTVLLVALLWVLAVAGVNLLPVLTGAGILGIVVGLGAQSLVKDFISGFFLLLEGQLGVGDLVRIDTRCGVVEAVGLRVTVLRDTGHQRHYVPNGAIGALTVYSDPWLQFLLQVPLPAAGTATEAAESVSAVLAELNNEYPGAFVGGEVSVAGDAKSGQTVRAEISVFPGQEWLVQEELPERVRYRLRASGQALPDDCKVRVTPGLEAMPKPA
jgi:moderate conductance mechanosensitive channel